MRLAAALALCVIAAEHNWWFAEEDEKRPPTELRADSEHAILAGYASRSAHQNLAADCF